MIGPESQGRVGALWPSGLITSSPYSLHVKSLAFQNTKWGLYSYGSSVIVEEVEFRDCYYGLDVDLIDVAIIRDSYFFRCHSGASMYNTQEIASASIANSEYYDNEWHCIIAQGVPDLLVEDCIGSGDAGFYTRSIAKATR